MVTQDWPMESANPGLDDGTPLEFKGQRTNEGFTYFCQPADRELLPILNAVKTLEVRRIRSECDLLIAPFRRHDLNLIVSLSLFEWHLRPAE